MRVKFVPLIFLSIMVIGCSKQDNKNHDPDPEDDPQVEYEQFSVDFTEFDLSPYSNLLQSRDSRFNPALLEFFQQSAGDRITSVSSSGDNHERLNVSDFPGSFTNVQGLIIGSQNQDGEITLEFSKTLYQVTIQIEQYYNIYIGHDFATEQNEIQYDCQRYNEVKNEYEGYSTITANGKRWTGSGETYRYFDDYSGMYIDIPETNTATFKINANQLKLTGFASERCRIYSMTLEFVK